MIEIQPTPDKPLPFDLSDEQPKTHADSIAIAANTVDLVERLGASLDFDAKDFQAAAALAKPQAPARGAVVSEAERSAGARPIKPLLLLRCLKSKPLLR